MKSPIFQSSARSRRHRQPTATDEQAVEAEAPFFDRSADRHGARAPFFQTKLAIGQPGDPYEREADAVADAVVNNGSGQPAARTGSIQPVQKLATPAEEKMPGTNDGRMAEDKKVQEMPLQKADAPETKEEPVQKAEAPEKKEEPVQKADAPEKKEEPVQKMDAPEKKEEKPAVQSKADGKQPTAPRGLSSRLDRAKAGGRPLPPAVRAGMERAIGADFSAVRIHTDGESAELNRDLQARAFTNGQHVFFNEGNFSPESTDGKRLLAHELTHVVQQNGGQGEVRRDPILPISTPLPAGAQRDELTGDATTTVGGIKVIILPDGRDTWTHTLFRPVTPWDIQYETANGKVTAFTGPGVTEVSIQTFYGPGENSKMESTYGRGTTAEDKKAKNTSLGFHEGSHGTDYLDFMAANPFPAFTGKVGMKTADFEKAKAAFGKAFTAWFKKGEAFSIKRTECVGTTIDQATGSKVCKP